MSNILSKLYKYSIYGTAFIAIIATSPNINYYGTSDWASIQLEISTEERFIPFNSSVLYRHVEDADAFNSCGWELILEFSDSWDDNTEILIWQLNAPWAQETFVNNFNDLMTSMDPDFDPTAPIILGSDAHRYIHEIMYYWDDLSYAAYEIHPDGYLSTTEYSPYYDVYSNIDFYAPCGDSHSYFLITVLGGDMQSTFDIQMIGHQSERITGSPGCGGPPDYSDVDLQVSVSE